MKDVVKQCKLPYWPLKVGEYSVKKKKKLSDIFNHFKRNLLPIRESSKPKKSVFLFKHRKFLQLLGKKKEIFGLVILSRKNT